MKKALKTIKSKLKVPKSRSMSKLDEQNEDKNKTLPNAKAESQNEQNPINSPETLDEEKNTFFEQQIKAIKHKRFKVSDFSEANFGNYTECVHKEKEYNFIRICRICCVPFSFKTENPQEYKNACNTKTQLLASLPLYVRAVTSWITQNAIDSILELLDANLFLPSTHPDSHIVSASPHLPLVFSDWQHRRLVYEFVLVLVTNTRTSAETLGLLAADVVLRRFLLCVLSKNAAERFLAQRTIHRLYSRHKPARAKIRGFVGELLDEFAAECRASPGLEAILLFVSSFASGFAVPLKRGHVDFFRRHILPLCFVPGVELYAQALEPCVGEFVAKENALAAEVVASLVRIMKIESAEKRELKKECPAIYGGVKGEELLTEAVFISLLEAFLPVVAEPFVKSNKKALASLLLAGYAKCLTSPNFAVAERAIALLESLLLQRVIQMDFMNSIPAILEALAANKTHWSDIIRQKSDADLKQMVPICKGDMVEMREKLRNAEKEKKRQTKKELGLWNKL